jgi:hypothetical protein
MATAKVLLGDEPDGGSDVLFPDVVHQPVGGEDEDVAGVDEQAVGSGVR